MDENGGTEESNYRWALALEMGINGLLKGEPEWLAAYLADRNGFMVGHGKCRWVLFNPIPALPHSRAQLIVGSSWVAQTRNLDIIWTPFPSPTHPIVTMSTLPMECLLNPSLPTTSTFLRSCHLSPSPLQKPPILCPRCGSLLQTALPTVARVDFLNVSINKFCFKTHNPTPTG